MAKRIRSIISVLLCILIVTTSVLSVSAQSTDDQAEIVSTTMDTNSDDSNLDKYYYSNEQWEKKYPKGLYIIEYDSYGVYEGGADIDNREDVYLGVVIYRIGGNKLSDTVTYYITGVSADSELYPDSMGTVSFEPGQVTATAKIKIKNDDVRKGDQLLLMSLAEAQQGEISAASTALITVTDDEPYVESEILLSVKEAVVDKSDGGVDIIVKRVKNESDFSTLTLYTVDGTAKAGKDYQAVEKELIFGAGESEKVVTIPFIQTEDKFTNAKNFTVAVKDLKGCKVYDSDSLRVDFTNTLSNEAKKLTEVEDSADVMISEMQSLADSSSSVVNINDNFNRKQMLMAAIGSANGTAVQSASDEPLRTSGSNNWTPYLYVPHGDFSQVYTDGSGWSNGEQYNNGNQNVMIASANTYDFNHFTEVYYSFNNHRVLLNGYPNTAIGYFVDDDSVFSSDKFSYIKGDVFSDEDSSDYKWMQNNNTYVVKNYNNCDVDKQGGDFAAAKTVAEMQAALNGTQVFKFSKGNGTYYPNTTGIEGANQSLFFMIYDDEGWDDHHFMLDYAVLKRDITPFRMFESTAVDKIYVEEKALDSGNTDVTLVIEQGGYKWSIKPVAGNGGIATINENADEPLDKYGFYTGSKLDFTFSTTTTTGQAAPVPEYLYFADESGRIHNGAKVSGSSFVIDLESVMTKDLSLLQNSCYMSEAEAKYHAESSFDKNRIINSVFEDKIVLDIRYVVKQSINLNYSNVPVLCEKALTDNGSLETDEQYKNRLLSVLDGVIEFYLNGEEVTPEPEINATNKVLQYSETEFDYLYVTPSAMGVGAVVTSNLSDTKYSRMESAEKISNEICRQNSSTVEFKVLSADTTYVNPSIQLSSISVNRKVNSEFETSYIANPLDRFLPFEALYTNTNEGAKDISYYTVDFTISDIYVEGAKNCEPKDFLVTVFDADASTAEASPLFEFTFTGGASGSSKEIELRNLASSFTKNDNIQVDPSVDVEGFKPKVKLNGLSNEGYSYTVYIPTFYSYQGISDYSAYYDTVFEGDDGVRIEVSEISEEKPGEIVTVLDVLDTQYVNIQIPSMTSEADGQTAEAPYSDVQQEFYVYRENSLLLGSPNLNIDCTQLTVFIAKIMGTSDILNGTNTRATQQKLARFAGSGLYFKFGSDTITMGIKIGYAPDITSHKTVVPYRSANAGNVATAQRASGKDALQQATNSKTKAGMLGFMGDISIQITYDTLRHKYVFTKFSATATGSVTVSANIPLSVPGIFIAVATTIAFTIGTGCAQVLNYVDQNGVSKYKALWSGVPVSDAISISATIGFGFSGILAAELGGSFDTTLSATLGASDFSPKQLEIDIYDQEGQKNGRADCSFEGDWTFKRATREADTAASITEVVAYEKFSFKDTLVHSNKAGSVLTINVPGATGIQLTGIAHKNGGIMEVTIKHAVTGETIRNSVINTISDKERRGATLFNWNTEDYVNGNPMPLVVTVKHLDTSPENSSIILDSIRVMNPAFYKDDILPAKINSFFFKIALVIKFTAGPFRVTLDPGYMSMTVLEDKYSITLGTLGYSYTWNYNMKQAQRLEATGNAEADENIPLLTASDTIASSAEEVSYFDTGDYGSKKLKKLLASNVGATSDTQSVYYKGKVYSFYTAMTKDAQNKHSYQIYCSVDNSPAKVVTESERYINEFYVFIDSTNGMVVEYVTADSTMSHMEIDSNGVITAHFANGESALELKEPADLEKLLQHTCVKIAVFDEAKGVFGEGTVIAATDANGRMESIPAASDSNGGASVIFYVVDEKTNVDADYNINAESRDEGISNGINASKELYDAIYNGRNELYYALYSDGKIVDNAAVRASGEILTEQELKAGYKIIEATAVMADADTVCLGYSVEIPYSVMDGHTGTLKELYWRTGEISDGKLTFGKKLTVESIMDFDENVNMFADGTEKLSERYYDAENGEYYSSIILSNLHMKNADINENDNISKEPCLFYGTNASINYITSSTAQKALNGEENDGVGVLYDGLFKDFVVAVSEDGAINLVYSDGGATAEYQDTLYFVNYSRDDEAWTKPRRLTYSDVFDREAFEDYETTGTLSFDSFDAYVNSNKEISVVLRSSYVPFVYELSAESDDVYGDSAVDAYQNSDYQYIDENGNEVKGIVFPTPDHDHELARSDIYSLTFEDPVTCIDVKEFMLTNPVFVTGETINTSFAIENVGDTSVNEMTVELFYKNLDTGAVKSIVQKEVTGTLLAGDSTYMSIDYEVGDDYYISDNTLLGINIFKGRKTLYNSYEDSYSKKQKDESFDNITYHIINNCAEYGIRASRADLDADGNLEFTAEVMNYGSVAAQNDVTLYCKAYDSDVEGNCIGTLFTYTISKDMLEVGDVAVIHNAVKAKPWMTEDKLYYNFELKTADTQYSTENDKQDISTSYQIPEINVDSSDFVQAGMRYNSLHSDGSLFFDLQLGEEVELNTDVLSKYSGLSGLSVYEVGTDCLSIDNSAVNGYIRVKAVGLPDGKEGIVKVLLHLRDTSVYRYVYIRITNRAFVEFDERVFGEGWKLSGQDHVYAVNFDLARTETDGSELNFKFYGDKLEIIGDYLTDGGDFEVTITDSKGKEVSKETVTTKAEKNNFGKVLYQSRQMGFGEYNVKLTAKLDEGERLSLDRAIYLIDTSSADTTHYSEVSSYSESLEAPMVSGRQRKASFTLNYSKPVKLAEGKALSELTLEFAELIKEGDDYVETGETITFTADKIQNNRLVFTAPLYSKQGCVLKYVLKDSHIAEGFITDTDGNAANTLIPDYNAVSYLLKESGILSVTVANDDSMPDGSVHKSVQVKFMAVPDAERLDGTKLMYHTTDLNGESKEIEFKYSGMTNDPRVAVYRADELTLEAEELEKTFSFEKGIVLKNDNYVLVTAQGDYLDNDIETVVEDKADLDIIYTKAKAENLYMHITKVGDNLRPVVYVEFNDYVDLQGSVDNAFINVRRTAVKNGETTAEELTLKAQNIETNGKAVMFTCTDAINLADADTVEFAVVSSKIQYSKDNSFIVTKYEKIAVNPAIESVSVKVNTKAYIELAEPYMGEDGTLYTKVYFSTKVADEKLSDTYALVTEQVEEYERSYDSKLSLEFVSAEEVDSKTVATYKYTGGESTALEYEDISKEFIAGSKLGIKGELTDINGEVLSDDILRTKELKSSRVKANSGVLTLLENGDSGYHVQLTVNYPEKVNASVMDNVYSTVYVETGAETDAIILRLVSVDENVLTFRTETPITLDNGEIITFTATSRFSDKLSEITDESGVGVSEDLSEVESLMVDNTNAGLVQVVTSAIEKGEGSRAVAVAEVMYNEVLRELSFTDSTINAYINVRFADGSLKTVNVDLVFDSIKNDNTAVFKADFEIPVDANAAQLVLGDSITTDGANSLYDINRTIFLSTELTKSNVAKAYKLGVETTAIIPLVEGTIEGVKDTAVAVTYAKPIKAEGLEGITLKVKIDGAEGVSEVLYRASEVYGNNTIVFMADEEITSKLANAITLSLSDSFIELEEGSGIYSASNGFAADLKVNNISEAFVTDTDAPDTMPTVPTATTSTATTVPTTVPDTQPDTSKAEATTATEPQSSKPTPSMPETESTEGKTDDSENPVTTGQSMGYIYAVMLMMFIAFAVIVILRKKQCEQ